MKHSTYLIVAALQLVALFTILQLGAIPRAASTLSLKCDEQYRREMQEILTQFSGFTNPQTLATYERYMMLLKQQGDLGFTLRPLETDFTSDQRARLRTPLQHYSTCRVRLKSALGITIFDPLAMRKILTPCETTYALELQAAMKHYTGSIPPTRLRDFQDFMVLIKRHEDISFMIMNFERTTPFEVFSKLRIPRQRYDSCKENIIRTFDSAQAAA